MARLSMLAALLAVASLLLNGCTPAPETVPAEVEAPPAEEGMAGEPAGEPEAAEQEPLPDASSEEVQAALDTAQEYIDEDEWQKALRVYDELACVAPNCTDMWIGRGFVLRGLAQPADDELNDMLMHEAISNFNTALELDDQLVQAYYERGIAHAIYGRVYFMEDGALGERGEEALNHAIEDFTAALELVPDDAQALLGRADAYETLGAYYDAIADYEAVLDIIPGNTTAEEGIARSEQSLDE